VTTRYYHHVTWIIGEGVQNYEIAFTPPKD
jgi:hypothetical protein